MEVVAVRGVDGDHCGRYAHLEDGDGSWPVVISEVGREEEGGEKKEREGGGKGSREEGWIELWRPDQRKRQSRIVVHKDQKGREMERKAL